MEKFSGQNRFHNMDPNRKIVKKPPYRFKCVNCGNCCSDPATIVTLTYYDLLRFKNVLSMDFEEIMDSIGFYVFKEKLTEGILNKMVIPPIETENGPAFLGLRKNEDGKCIFLKNNKCMIYRARPDVCRTFPFHFDARPHVGKSKEEEHIEIKMTLAEKAIEYCNGIIEDAPKINPKEWMNYGRETIRHMIEESALIMEWNKNVKKGIIEPNAGNYVATAITWGEKLLNNADKAGSSPIRGPNKTTVRIKKDDSEAPDKYPNKKRKTAGKKNYKQIVKERLREKK